VDKTIDDSVAWSHRGIVPFTLHDNMLTGLNFHLATGATKVRIWEEALVIFAYQSVSCGHVSEMCT